MGHIYRAREDNIDSTDTKAQINDLGDDADSDITAPDTNVVAAIISAGFNLDTAAKSASLFRAEGDGLPEGPYVLPGPAAGAPVATGNSYSKEALYIPRLQWPAVKGQVIQTFAERLGEDTGPFDAMLGLVFGSGMVEERAVRKYMVLEGELTGTDTAVSLTTQGSVTPTLRTFDWASKIVAVDVGFAASFDAANISGNVWAEIGGDAIGTTHAIPLGGFGGQAVQTGADPTANGFHLHLPVDIDVKKNENYTVVGQMSGDPGDATLVIGVGFA